MQDPGLNQFIGFKGLSSFGTVLFDGRNGFADILEPFVVASHKGTARLRT